MPVVDAFERHRRGAIRQSDALARNILGHWALPTAEAKALALAVRDLAQRFAVVCEVRGRSPVSVGRGGCLQVTFVLRGAEQNARPADDREVQAVFSRLAGWRLSPGRDITLQTTRTIMPANPRPEETKASLIKIGLQRVPVHPVFKACFDAIAFVSNQNGSRQQLRSTIALTREINAAGADADSKKLVQFLDDRTGLEKLEAPADYTAIARAISAILPAVSRAITETENAGETALRHITEIFGDSRPKVREFVQENLSKAHEFLASPRMSKIKLASQVPDINIYRKKQAKPDVVAFELYGVLYFFEERLVSRGGGRGAEDAILHEALHVFLIERYQRGDGSEDPAYRHEDHFYQLSVAEALSNPDSYVEYVRRF